jgi:replicative DNA helicase
MTSANWKDTAKAAARGAAKASRNGQQQIAPAQVPAQWDQPILLGCDYAVPPFPVACLPTWLADWVRAEAEATQTPPDLAATLALAICGAGLAGKFRVRVRDGWTEPTNIFTVCALLPGERKSAVFADAIAPVQLFEQEELARVGPVIAELACEHRILEGQLKNCETRAAKVSDQAEREQLKGEAKDLARKLLAHEVPDPPQKFCDDVTPEKLANLLARQGGSMLQASAEGTAFEIAKGRYSETANFEVYLKGHAGDPLRVGRISRPGDTVEQPALSMALAVQPDVIRGLAEQTSMRGRGFLARFLYSLPTSCVGRRKVAPCAMPAAVAKVRAHSGTAGSLTCLV